MAVHILYLEDVDGVRERSQQAVIGVHAEVRNVPHDEKLPRRQALREASSGGGGGGKRSKKRARGKGMKSGQEGARPFLDSCTTASSVHRAFLAYLYIYNLAQLQQNGW